MAKIQFAKIRDVHDPQVAYDSAGVDFFMPVNLIYEDLRSVVDCDIQRDLFWQITSITIHANGRVTIPSGIRIMGMPRESALIAFNKSGIASKMGLVVGACVVDYDYRGEIHINLINTGSRNITIRAGEKLTQFIHVPIFKEVWERVPESLIDARSKTERGSKGFGSSDKISTMTAGDFPNRPDPLGIMYDTSKSDSD